MSDYRPTGRMGDYSPHMRRVMRRYLDRHGVSLSEIGRRLGITYQAVQQMQSRKNGVRHELLIRWAQAIHQREDVEADVLEMIVEYELTA